ncbi:MAG: WecB/TagA/CpsF family glycosyltransferase [Myxococcota bacterium]
MESNLAAQLAKRHGVPTVDLRGFTFLDLDEPRFVRMIVEESRAGRGGWVVTPNADIVRLADQNPDIYTMVQSADALIADGMPLVWATRLQGTPLSGRVCGSDLTLSLPVAAAEAGLSIYLLGGAGDTGAETARILCERSPNLEVAGTYSPPFGFESNPDEIDAMFSRIAEAEPDVVFVALGFPKAERLIQRLRAARPTAWWLGVGAAFDFISGRYTRAPVWAQRAGLEWLFRLQQDPERLVDRYIRRDLPFVARLFLGALRQRIAKP